MILKHAKPLGHRFIALVTKDEMREQIWRPPDLVALDNSIDEPKIAYLLDLRRRVGPIGAYQSQLYRARAHHANPSVDYLAELKDASGYQQLLKEWGWVYLSRRSERLRRMDALSSRNRFAASLSAAVAMLASTGAMADQKAKPEPLTIQEQGSFAVGGTMVNTPGTYNNNKPTAEGQSFHGDHLYAFYQVPQNPKALPIVMLHGAFQSARSWETTSDGREGFQTLFLRRGFPVYLVDQPRRGRAGNSTVATTIEPTPYDQLFFDQFRIGTWPDYFDGVQFDRKPETLDQFFRSVTPNTGPYDAGVILDAMAALFEKTGPGILFTHSQAGGPGWLTAIKSENVKAIVSFEPGSGFVFPEGELPEAMPSAAGALKPEAVPLADFEKLTRIPDRHLLRRQHPDRADRAPRRGQLARAPRHGQALGGVRQQAWRRCQAGAPARDRYQGQHALPVLRPEQC